MHLFLITAVGVLLAGIIELYIVCGLLNILVSFGLHADIPSYVLIRRARSPLSSVPGPWHSRWTSAVSTYYWLRGELPTYIQGLHEQYGKVVRVSPRVVDFASISAAKRIHSFNRPFLKSQMYEIFRSGNGVINLFSTRDPVAHARHRKFLSGPISEAGLKSVEHVVHERAHLAVERIAQELKAIGRADVLKWWLFYSTDVIGELTFGDSFRMLEQGKVNAYAQDLQDLAAYVGVRVAFPKMIRIASYIPLPRFSAAYAATQRMRTYSETSICRYERIIASEPNISKPSLFNKLFNASEDIMSRDEIVASAQSYITAGSDTTAHSLTYLTWAVCRDKAIRAKLVEELQTLPDGYSDEHLKALPYLDYVIYETLRLYAAAPAPLPRDVPSGGCEIDGYWMPEGSEVQTQAYSMHRSSEVYPDPYRFDPERWKSPTKDMKDAWMPFGGGARACIGLHLAKMELRIAVAKLFRTFPKAKVSSLEGFIDSEMDQVIYFLMFPKGKRCLIQGS